MKRKYNKKAVKQHANEYDNKNNATYGKVNEGSEEGKRICVGQP